MSTRVFLVGLLLISAVPAESFGKVVLITRGDTISHVGNINAKGLPPNLAGGVDGIGYKYSYFGIFWLDLWRYDGQYCIYRGDQYQPVSDSEAAALLGIPESDLGKPFFYHLPPGLIVVGGLAAIGIVGAVRQQARKKLVMSVVGDPRYQRALEIFSETSRTNEEARKAAAEKNEPAPTEADPWEAAIAHLTAGGIERSEAEDKFAKVLAHALEQMAAQQQQQ